jgi:hypothetical protein
MFDVLRQSNIPSSMFDVLRQSNIPSSMFDVFRRSNIPSSMFDVFRQSNILFGISLISLFGYHIYLTCSNRSTLGKYVIEGGGNEG